MITETHNRGSTRNGSQPVPPQYQREEPPRRTASASTKAKRRHRKLILLYLFTFFVIIAAAIILSLTVLFKIDTIEVTGTSRYAAQEIIKASGIQKGENLFLTKTSQAGATIKTNLPYIGTVEVSRKLPAKILITVSDASAATVVKYQDKYVLISDNGKVLEQTSTMPSNCTIVLGLELASAQPGANITYKNAASKTLFEGLTTVLRNNKMDKITKIDLSNSYSILVEYDKRITMNLGLATGMDYKIRFAKNVINQKLEKNANGVLNLSIVEENNEVYFDTNDSSSSSSSDTSSKK